MIDAELRDATRPIWALFTWWGVDDPRTMPLAQVTLEAYDTFRVTTIVENPKIAGPLLRFLSEVGGLPDNWEGEQKFLSTDGNLRITCWQRRRGLIYMDVSLDADTEDPVWTVEVRMEIAESAWPVILRQFHDYFAAVEGERRA